MIECPTCHGAEYVRTCEHAAPCPCDEKPCPECDTEGQVQETCEWCGAKTRLTFLRDGDLVCAECARRCPHCGGDAGHALTGEQLCDRCARLPSEQDLRDASDDRAAQMRAFDRDAAGWISELRNAGRKVRL